MAAKEEIIEGQASDGNEVFDFTVERHAAGGFLLSIHYGGDEVKNVTGAGLWPTVEKAKSIAEQSTQRLLHGATVTWHE